MSDRLVVRGGTVVDVARRRLIRADVVIDRGRIVAVAADAGRVEGRVIDARGRLVSPGLIDAHLHIESSLLVPLEFARCAASRGTTAVFVDPHEIANVSGIPGIELFLEQAGRADVEIFVGIPSCVPATRLEPSGATLDVDAVRSLTGHERVYGLAEMMNYPAIIDGTGDAREKVDAVLEHGLVVDGHCPGLGGESLSTYVSNGRGDGVVRIMYDHECSTAEEALEKHRAGMTIAVRHSWLTQDLERILPGVLAELGEVPERFMLCSDDLDPLELMSDGHMDRTVRRTRDILLNHGGFDLESATSTALALATREPARYFARALRDAAARPDGEIACGARADLVVFDGVETLRPEIVLNGGRVVFGPGSEAPRRGVWDYGSLSDTIRVAGSISPEDFRIVAADRGSCMVRVIGAQPGRLGTRQELADMGTVAGALGADAERDIAKIAVIERHRGTGEIGLGFVRGLGLARGAVASTVAHDSHNLVVAGMDDVSMATAAKRLVEHGGGLAFASGDRAISLPLPVAGLMSDDPAGDVVERYRALLSAAGGQAGEQGNPFMTLSFLSLPVIPELRITSRGLVDVKRFEHVPLIAS
jgi:adenine deaminase